MNVPRETDQFESYKNKELLSFYLKSFFVTTSVLILGIILTTLAYSEQISDETAVRCIVGEASNQGEIGMYALASGLLNRGTIKGVYGCTAKHVYKEPEWVWEMARVALNKAKIRRLHDGTNWENIREFGKPAWAYKMQKVYEYKDHVFYKEIKK